MFELTAENALDYLRAHLQLDDTAIAEQLCGGVSNQVLRITAGQHRFVLKQSRPQLRTRDAWFSDLERIYREQEVMQTLHPYLPNVVPEVLFADRSNFIYAMSHAPLEAQVWKSLLLNGNINGMFGLFAGQVLGFIHQVSATSKELFEAFCDHSVYVQLRVDPFYRRVQERRPEVAHVVETIIEQMLTLKEALCHGDYTPKNMLVHWGQQYPLTLVDYETAHLGDPTMDLGLFLAHLILKMIRAPDRCDQFLSLMRVFWHNYFDNARYLPQKELEQRGVRHLGVCLLARVDGTSPVDYLPEESKRELVRRLGVMILLDNITEWDQVWRLCQYRLEQLAR
jgi:5-methylthioribose kinase